MEFEWDTRKNKSNAEKHGISFDEAVFIFDNPVFTMSLIRSGEKREISIGTIDGKSIVVLVVHTERNKKCRIISARPAKKKERRIYYDYIEKET